MGKVTSMNRLLFQIRALLTALLLGLGLAFGVSAAIGGTIPCTALTDLHQTAEAAPVVVDAACQDRSCVPSAAACCTDMMAGSCSLAALVQPGASLETIRRLDHAEWLAEPTSILVGHDPQASRRPPRSAA